MSRKATMLVRRCTATVIVATVCCLAVTANAASCDIPSFLNVGKTYTFMIRICGGDATVLEKGGKTYGFGGDGTVLEIDKQSCWVRIKGIKEGRVVWCDLNQLLAIVEK